MDIIHSVKNAVLPKKRKNRRRLCQKKLLVHSAAERRLKKNFS
jgi:hypothetical protein